MNKVHVLGPVDRNYRKKYAYTYIQITFRVAKVMLVSACTVITIREQTQCSCLVISIILFHNDYN